MTLEEQVIPLYLERYSEQQIAKRLKVSPRSIKGVVARLDEEWKRFDKAQNRTERLISQSYRSNLGVLLDTHSREFYPKPLPGDGGRGLHFLPSGVVDPDFEDARNHRAEFARMRDRQAQAAGQ